MKPNLILPSAAGGNAVNIMQTTRDVLTNFAASGVYYRKGDVVVRTVPDKQVGVKLEPITPAYMQTLLFERFNVLKWAGRGNNAGLFDAVEIKDITLKAIIGSHLVEQMVLPVQVITTSPYLVYVDGNLVQLKNGYNPERGGILVTSGIEPVTVPIDEAVKAIQAVYADYDFATPSDRSRCIAGPFCTGIRLAGIYERGPFLGFEADVSQAGKTKMWGVHCAMVGQRYGTVAQKKGGVGSLDEQLMEKMVDGCTAILLDNMRGRLDSTYFEACLAPEGGDLSARIAGVRSVPVDPRLTQFGLTSNGVELTLDAANRALITRIRKRRHGYSFRQWTDAAGRPVGLREHVEAHRSYYHGCVNSVILDWWKNGAQRLECEDHDFKESVGALDYVVRHYFGLPPLLDGHRAALDRTTKPGLSWLRLIALKAAKEWNVDDWSASKLAERCVQDGVAIPGVTNDSDPKVAAQQVGLAMASAFGLADSVTIDEVQVTRKLEQDTKGHMNKFYSFRRVGA